MKIKFIMLFFVLMLAMNSAMAQVDKDTTVCIIDTTKTFVHFHKMTNPKLPSFEWQIFIDGHYYDHYWGGRRKDFACIILRGVKQGVSDTICHVKVLPTDSMKITIARKDIKNRFQITDDKWVNQQTDQDSIARKIGYIYMKAVCYVVFSQDYEDMSTDSVILHRTIVSYNETIID